MSPIVPPPSTATSVASVPRPSACTQAANGSAIAAPAKSRPSGIACRAPIGAAMRSAKPPSTQVGARQIAARPARHGPQAPHATESPTRTRSPVSARTPAVSWPKRAG